MKSSGRKRFSSMELLLRECLPSQVSKGFAPVGDDLYHSRPHLCEDESFLFPIDFNLQKCSLKVKYFCILKWKKNAQKNCYKP